MADIQKRIILSRKGFDSGTGGKPSPIWKDELFSFPIPEVGSGIQYKNLNGLGGKTCAKILKDLGIKPFKEAHLDPDIRADIWKDIPPKWKPSFGQHGSSLSHLMDTTGKYWGPVRPGDLFLFFGWFKEVERVKGKFQYIKGATDKHVLFGYLEIGEIHRLSELPQANEFLHHPHQVFRDKYNSRGNAIFEAAPSSTFFEGKAGSGIFGYDEKLVLSDPDAKTKSIWRLPKGFFNQKKCLLTYHQHKAFTPKGDHFQVKSVGRGQEFIAPLTPKIEMWVNGLAGFIR